MRDEDVASPKLGDAHFIDAHDAEVDSVAEPLQVARRKVKNVAGVAFEAGNVLHDDCGRFDDLGGAHHLQVERVLGVAAARVIVQVRMPLARRTANEEIDISEQSLRSPFFQREPFVGRAIEPLFDRARVAPISRVEVASVRRGDEFAPLDGEPNVATATKAAGSFDRAQRHSPASCEEVDKTDTTATPFGGARRLAKERSVVSIDLKRHRPPLVRSRVADEARPRFLSHTARS